MISNQIYSFAFIKNNISTRTLYRLKNVDRCYQVFGETSIDKYLEFLLHDNPPYILGLGVYSGVDQNKIRIERKCSNKFRNGFIEGNKIETLGISAFLEPEISSKYANGIGNSYCNMVSWKIVRLTKQKKLKSKYTFLHIPKMMKTEIAVNEIDNMLQSFKSTVASS